MDAGQVGARAYAGRTAQVRAAERRERWMAAGLELFGTVGFAGTSLRALARQSGVAERYFAENFTDLEDLFVAVHQRLHDELTDEVTRVLQETEPAVGALARAGLGALVDGLMRDPRVARIKLVESAVAGPRMVEVREDSLREVAAFLVAGRDPRVLPPGIRLDVLGIGLAAAVFDLILAWHQGRLAITQEALVEHCAVLCVAVHDGLAPRGRPRPSID